VYLRVGDTLGDPGAIAPLPPGLQQSRCDRPEPYATEPRLRLATDAAGCAGHHPGEGVPHSHPDPASPARLCCRQCGDVIGVYEPLVVVEQEGPRLTALAAEPGQFPVGAACFHAACHERMSADSASSAWSA
jgi:hypothetical protein